MLTFNKTINFNGSSQVNEKSVANFTASYDNGNLYFNKNVQDIEKFSEYQETVTTDYEEFEEKVMAVIGASNITTVTEETE